MCSYGFFFFFREDEVKQQLRLHHVLLSPTEQEENEMIERIQEIFQQKYRRYLSVFRLGQDTSLTNTIFRAILNSKKKKHTCLNLST